MLGRFSNKQVLALASWIWAKRRDLNFQNPPGLPGSQRSSGLAAVPQTAGRWRATHTALEGGPTAQAAVRCPSSEAPPPERLGLAPAAGTARDRKDQEEQRALGSAGKAQHRNVGFIPAVQVLTA